MHFKVSAKDFQETPRRCSEGWQCAVHGYELGQKYSYLQPEEAMITCSGALTQLFLLYVATALHYV